MLFALYSCLYCYGVFLLWDVNSVSHDDCAGILFTDNCTANIWWGSFFLVRDCPRLHLIAPEDP